MIPLQRPHQLAEHPPKFDMLYRGARRWQEYEDACKELEREIEEGE